MQASLKPPIANDNVPFLPLPLETKPIPSAPQSKSTKNRDIIATLLILWTLPLGIVAGLFPGELSGTTILLALMAAGLTAYASAVRSALMLTMAICVSMLTVASIWQTGVTPLAGLIWPLSLSILWCIQALLAANLKSGVNAALLSISLVAGIAGLTAGMISYSGLAALGSVGGFLYLGIARAGSKSKINTAEVHYVGAWLLTVISAVTLAIIGFTGLTAEMWVILSIISIAAFALWATQGLFPLSQSLCVGAIGLAVVVPAARDFIATDFGVLPGFPVHILLGAAAVTAAGAALCARGLKRNHTTTLLIGLFTAFAAMMATVQSFHGSMEALIVYTLCGALMTAWLFTARVSGA